MNQRQELFCQGIFVGKTATEACISAGYSAKTAYSAGQRLLKHVEVKARIKELNDAAVTEKVMSVAERKERLSEIARARYSDFVTAGPDGSWIDIGPEKANSAAICEVKSKTEYDDNGDKPAVIISVKLHDPIRAINELNKMEGAHAPVETKVNGKITHRHEVHEFSNGHLAEALQSLAECGAVKVSAN
jgi:phage terminase small subunit